MNDPIDAISRKLSRYSFFNGGRSSEVAEYRIATGINLIGVIVLTTIMGNIFNSEIPALIAMISFFLLRIFSGGFHFRSLTLCLVVTVLLFSGISLISVWPTVTITANIIAVTLLLFFSPSNLNQIPKMLYTSLKVFSIIIVLINFYFLNGHAALAFLVQAVLLIPYKEVLK